MISLNPWLFCLALIAAGAMGGAIACLFCWLVFRDGEPKPEPEPDPVDHSGGAWPRSVNRRFDAIEDHLEAVDAASVELARRYSVIANRVGYINATAAVHRQRIDLIDESIGRMETDQARQRQIIAAG